MSVGLRHSYHGLIRDTITSCVSNLFVWLCLFPFPCLKKREALQPAVDLFLAKNNDAVTFWEVGTSQGVRAIREVLTLFLYIYHTCERYSIPSLILNYVRKEYPSLCHKPPGEHIPVIPAICLQSLILIPQLILLVETTRGRGGRVHAS